jgi:serine/threonine protein kinase/formylglycine-generating enzyme required for sulfatase activity
VSSEDRLVGQVLAGYEILSKLGAGGMGAVYKARNTRLDKLVAVKILPPHIQGRVEFVVRFRREARMAAQLDHPNIVRVYDYGEEGGVIFFVMEYVEGLSLAGYVKSKKNKVSVKEALHIVTEVAKGLERAHEDGLIHRDIKPDNIMISKRGRIMIADFGLVKQSSEVEGGLTAAGAILGTPYYMSPEQCEGVPDIDARADLYSLGLVLYTLLTGQRPVEGETPLQIIHNRMTKDIPPPTHFVPQLPAPINQLIMALLARQREQRIPNATTLLGYLQQLEPFVAQVDTPLENTNVSFELASQQMAESPTMLSPTVLNAGQASMLSGEPSAISMGGVSYGPLTGAIAPESSKLVPLLLLIAILAVIGAGSLLYTQGVPGQMGEVTVSEWTGLPRWTSQTKVTIIGKTNRGPVGLSIDGQLLETGSDGSFTCTLNLSEGMNEILVEVQGGEGSYRKSHAVNRDSIKPQIFIEGEKSGQLVLNPGQVLKGQLKDKNPREVLINGRKIELRENGAFSFQAGSDERLTIKGLDHAGNKDQKEITVIRRAKLVIERLTALEKWSRTSEVTIKGQLSRKKLLNIIIQGKKLQSDVNGQFSQTITMAEGPNIINIEITDLVDQAKTSSRLTTHVDSIAPVLLFPGARTRKPAPEGQAEDWLVIGDDGLLKGQVREANLLTLQIDKKNLGVDKNGQFIMPVPALKEPVTVTVVATDRAGHRRSKRLTIMPKGQLTVTLADKDGVWSNQKTFALKGSASSGPVTIELGAIKFKSQVNGNFKKVVALKEGENTLVMSATSETGATAEASLIVFCDSKRPVIAISELENGVITLKDPYVFKGQVSDDNFDSLSINGNGVIVKNGAFEHKLLFHEKPQTIKITARDKAGNEQDLNFSAHTTKQAVAADAPTGILADLRSWTTANAKARLDVAQSVARRLGKKFRFLKMKTFKCGGTRFEIATYKHRATGYEFSLIPGGTYLMGNKSNRSEKPVHEVSIRPFLMGRFEVACIVWTSLGSAIPPNSSRKNYFYAVSGVSWNVAQGWCDRAQSGFRLPSEAEWEYACRAGSTTEYFWGADARKIPQYCWYYSNTKETERDQLGGMKDVRKARPVLQHDNKYNAFGLVDMLGNVKEWCEDDYRENYEFGPKNQDPVVVEDSKNKVCRGGAFSLFEVFLRSSSRQSIRPGDSNKSNGFRVAVSIPSK